MILPSVQIKSADVIVMVNGERLKPDENYVIARQGFWKAWQTWGYRPWKARRAWRDRNTHYIEFRFPPAVGETVTVKLTPP
jgi:hypothetical protein